jgi:hypothetical protein
MKLHPATPLTHVSRPTIYDRVSKHGVRLRPYPTRPVNTSNVVNQSPPSNDTPRVSDRIFDALANIVDAAIQTGDVLDRWRKRVNAMFENAMFENIPGCPLLSKLRVIHILEADVKLALGIIWSRRLMAQGEKRSAFRDEN